MKPTYRLWLPRGAHNERLAQMLEAPPSGVELVLAMPNAFAPGISGVVVGSRGAVMAGALPSSIGRGTLAARTQWRAQDLDDAELLEEVRGMLASSIGRGSWDDLPAYAENAWPRVEPSYRRFATAFPDVVAHLDCAHWLGTLGDLDQVSFAADETGSVWVCVRAGESAIGYAALRSIVPGRAGVDAWEPVGDPQSVKDLLTVCAFAERWGMVNRSTLLGYAAGVMGACLGDRGIVKQRTKMDPPVVDTLDSTLMRVDDVSGDPLWVARSGVVQLELGEQSIVFGPDDGPWCLVRALVDDSGPNMGFYAADAGLTDFTAAQIVEAHEGMLGVERTLTPFLTVRGGRRAIIPIDRTNQLGYVALRKSRTE